MHSYKKDLIHFFVWMRNGTAFCTTWFLILLLLYNSIYHIPTVSTTGLLKLVLLSIGGVFLFNLFFTRLFIKKWRFIKRLTCFMVTISFYECFGFYLLHFFQSKGSFTGWLLFVGIVFFLYICCIAIYQQYSKRQGNLYTQSLQAYQQKRRVENGK